MKENNQIQQFHNDEFGSFDILTINGAPYFPATECAETLGYKRPHDAVARHCPHSVKRGVGVQTGKKADGSPATQTIEKTYIPEGDLYRLIIRSKLPAAVRFESWVCDEILPTIRKHGAYATYDTLNQLLRSPEFAQTLINNLEKERARNAALENLATEMAPKALYCDLVLQSENVVPVSLIAKDYGMSATRLNTLLHAIGVQYKISGTWLLYQKYADMGYTQTRTYYVGEKIAAMHTCWTQKGRLFLYEQLKGIGILPMIECQSDKRFPA
jgi:prophage antirepressor-like protein